MAATGGDLRSPASVPVPHQREGQHRVRAQGARPPRRERERLVHEAVRWARLEHLLGSPAPQAVGGRKAARGARPGTRTEAATVPAGRAHGEPGRRIPATGRCLDSRPVRFRRRRTDRVPRSADHSTAGHVAGCTCRPGASSTAEARCRLGIHPIARGSVGKLPLHRRRACGGRPSRTTRIRQKPAPPAARITRPRSCVPLLPVQAAPGRCSSPGRPRTAGLTPPAARPAHWCASAT